MGAFASGIHTKYYSSSRERQKGSLKRTGYAGHQGSFGHPAPFKLSLESVLAIATFKLHVMQTEATPKFLRLEFNSKVALTPNYAPKIAIALNF